MARAWGLESHVPMALDRSLMVFSEMSQEAGWGVKAVRRPRGLFRGPSSVFVSVFEQQRLTLDSRSSTGSNHL